MDRRKQLGAMTMNMDARGKKLLVSLATDPTEDPFRTVCPGPATGEIVGPSGILARAPLPLRELGRRRLRIGVAGHGRFVAGSYAGSRSARVTVGLQLVRVRAGTKVESVSPGEP